MITIFLNIYRLILVSGFDSYVLYLFYVALVILYQSVLFCSYDNSIYFRMTKIIIKERAMNNLNLCLTFHPLTQLQILLSLSMTRAIIIYYFMYKDICISIYQYHSLVYKLKNL